MRAWTIKIGEPLPVDRNTRKFRMNEIAHHLVEKGFSVIWWTSSFDHARHKKRILSDTEVNVCEDFKIKFLSSPGYKNNVSISRAFDHFIIAVAFLVQGLFYERPDIIICAMPTIDLAFSSLIISRIRRIPLVVDVRDQWPDILMISKHAPVALRMYYKWENMLLKKVIRNAYSITTLSEGFLEWVYKKADRRNKAHDAVLHMGYKNTRGEYFGSNSRSTRLRVVYSGSINDQFDFQPIVEAINSGELRNLDFIFCGDGNLLKQLMKDLEQQPNVRFTGYLDEIRLNLILGEANIGIAPYRAKKNYIDNITNKFVEYAAWGLPILISINGEMRNLVEKYKCGAFYHDSSEFIRILKNYDTQRDELENARASCIQLHGELFDSEKNYSEYAEHIIGLITKDGGIDE